MDVAPAAGAAAWGVAERDAGARVGGSVQASVAPEKVLRSSPMGKISGTSSYIYFETDNFPGLAITGENPGPWSTLRRTGATAVRCLYGNDAR